MSKTETKTNQDFKVWELPLPTGDMPKLGEMTPKEFQKFLDKLPFSEEQKKGLLDRFVERKEKSLES